MTSVTLTLSFLLILITKPHVNAFADSDEEETTQCFSDHQQRTNDDTLSLGHTELSQILIEGSHSFAFELLKALHKFEAKESSDGLLVSPSSIWSALIITYMGANGDTEKEMKNVLKLKNIPKSAVAMAYQGLRLWSDLKRNMTKASAEASEKTTYSMVNKIYYNQNLKLNSCIDEYFFYDVQAMDFFRKPLKSVTEINDWIEEQTRGRIKDLIPNGSVTPWTKMIIANAVYFKSKWMNQFEKENTKQMTFYSSPTDEIQIEMMTQQGTFMYGISDRLQATAIELQYANPDYSMIMILPQISKGLDSLIQTLRPSDLYELVSNMYDDEVNVVMPKFHMQQQFELSGPLYSLGIKKLFDPRYSDLSGFFDNQNNSQKQSIILNSVVHKSDITVNEEGTEASAATALIYGRSGRPVFPTQFIANRPFLYLIRDTATNFILFMGTVRRPKQEFS